MLETTRQLSRMHIPSLQLLAASGTPNNGQHPTGIANTSMTPVAGGNSSAQVVPTTATPYWQGYPVNQTYYPSQGGYSSQPTQAGPTVPVYAQNAVRTTTKTKKAKTTKTHGPATVEWTHASGLTGQTLLPGQTGHVYAYPSSAHPNQPCLTYIPGYQNNNNGTAPTTVPVCVEQSAAAPRAVVPQPFRAMGSLFNNGRRQIPYN